MTHIIKIFSILVSNEKQTKLSQESYPSYEKAVEFIESRSDNPQKLSSHFWNSGRNSYEICETEMIRM